MTDRTTREGSAASEPESDPGAGLDTIDAEPLADAPTIEGAPPTEGGRPAPPGRAGRPSAIGPYRVLGTLGEGVRGIVYEAEQRQPRRRVALKVIEGGSYVDERRVTVFRRGIETVVRPCESTGRHAKAEPWRRAPEGG